MNHQKAFCKCVCFLFCIHLLVEVSDEQMVLNGCHDCLWRETLLQKNTDFNNILEFYALTLNSETSPSRIHSPHPLCVKP